MFFRFFYYFEELFFYYPQRSYDFFCCCCLATTGTHLLRFGRGYSLSLGRLVYLKPLCLRRQEWKYLRERFAKESCGAVKGFPLGFPGPLPWSSTLSRSFLQLVPVRLFRTV